MVALFIFINGFTTSSFFLRPWLHQAELKKARQAWIFWERYGHEKRRHNTHQSTGWLITCVESSSSSWVLNLELEKLLRSCCWKSIGSLSSGETRACCIPGIFLGEIRNFGCSNPRCFFLAKTPKFWPVKSILSRSKSSQCSV